MTETAKELFTTDTVLTRRDGRKMKPFPRSPTEQNEMELTRNVPPPEKKNVIQDDKRDGFCTHIRCRWCGSIIKDYYIPKLKDGKNGQPYDLVVNYEPCESCRNQWNTMVVCIEITDKEPYPNCLPITQEERLITDGYIHPYHNVDEYKTRVVREELKPGRSANDEGEPNQYEMVTFYPTGRYVGVTLEAMLHYFTETPEPLKNGSVVYMEPELFNEAFSQYFGGDTVRS